MEDYIQSRIDGLKLLGFSVKKHSTGLYVAFSNNKCRCNVYNSKFEPIVVGKEIVKINSNFLETRSDNEMEVYSTRGNLLIKDTEGHKDSTLKHFIHAVKDLEGCKIKVDRSIIYVSKDKKLQYIITKDGKEVFDVPNVRFPYCNIGTDGKLYTLTPSGDLYCGTEIVDTDVPQGIGYYSSHFYVKAENNKAKVYSLCTQKPIDDTFYEDVTICDDKVLLKIKDGSFNYYHNGIIKHLDCKGVQEITFLYNINHTKVFFKLKYDNYLSQIANLDMEILIDKYYTYVSSDIYDKYVQVFIGADRVGIVDLELGTCIQADTVLIDSYGIEYIDNGEKHNIYY